MFVFASIPNKNSPPPQHVGLPARTRLSLWAIFYHAGAQRPPPSPPRRAQGMFAMFKKVAAKERICGFYSTGPKIRENDLAIAELFK